MTNEEYKALVKDGADTLYIAAYEAKRIGIKPGDTEIVETPDGWFSVAADFQGRVYVTPFREKSWEEAYNDALKREKEMK